MFGALARMELDQETPAIPHGLLRFRRRYGIRKPLIPYPVLANEMLQLCPTYGFRLLDYAPAQDVDLGLPPRSRREDGHHRYLWVINDEGIPFIYEVPIAVLNCNYPKHTNLTGGEPAYAGGELWFRTDASLFVSGGSGRYEPIHAEQLNDAVGVFEAYGYAVTSLGWDASIDRPRRLL